MNHHAIGKLKVRGVVAEFQYRLYSSFDVV
jgi:hypothetical protein